MIPISEVPLIHSDDPVPHQDDVPPLGDDVCDVITTPLVCSFTHLLGLDDVQTSVRSTGKDCVQLRSESEALVAHTRTYTHTCIAHSHRQLSIRL